MKPLYENSYYSVTINPDNKVYCVTNKFTNVVENFEQKLPTAINMAKALETSLRKLMETEK